MTGDQPRYFLLDIRRREDVEVRMRVFERERVGVWEVIGYLDLKLKREVEEGRGRKWGCWFIVNVF